MGTKHVFVGGISLDAFGGKYLANLKEVKGNSATVVYSIDSKDVNKVACIQLAAKYHDSVLSVVSNLVTTTDTLITANIRWFSKYGEIKFCGHGAFAAADDIFRAHPSRTLLHLQHSDGTLIFTQQQESMYQLMMDNVELVHHSLYSTLENVINLKPIRVAHSKDVDGYIILEVKNKEEVTLFDFNITDYCQLTTKALIVSSIDKINSTIFFRYFAPQYGVTEDSATGSAAPVLATFWQQEIANQEYLCHQLSQKEGCYTIAVKNRQCYIKGKVIDISH